MRERCVKCGGVLDVHYLIQRNRTAWAECQNGDRSPTFTPAQVGNLLEGLGHRLTPTVAQAVKVAAVNG